MIKKRITALIVIFSFLVTLIPGNMTIAGAESSAPVMEDGKIILKDFADKDDIPSEYLSSENKYLSEYSTDVAYEGKPGSLKWTMDEIGTDFDFALDKYDYTTLIGHPDARIRMRFYSEAVGSKFNFLYLPDKANFSGKYSIVYPVIAGGWQVVDLKLSDVLSKVQYSKLGLLSVRFNDTGWANYSGGGYTPGDVIYIDSIWIEFPDYGKTLVQPVPSIENGATFVDRELGGSNTYTLSFSENLWEHGHITDGEEYTAADAVKVYEFDGEDYVLTGQSHSVTVSGSSISVTFDAPLKDVCAYMVRVDKNAVLSMRGHRMTSDVEFYFSVGMGSANFNMVSTSVAEGASVDGSEPGFEYRIEFSNTPDNYDINNMFSVFRDGEQFDGFFEVDSIENTVIITFPDGLAGGCEYKVTVSDDFADTNGIFISGAKEFTFKTFDVVGNDGLIFSASDSDDMDAVFADGAQGIFPSGFSIERETENVLTGDETFRFNHPSIAANKQCNIIMAEKIVRDITDYEYINYLIYSPEATDESVVLQMIDKATWNDKAWYVAMVKTDWEGWKKVSVKISDFTNKNMNGFVNAFVFNLGGWSNTKTQSGYFLVDRIWLSNEPSSEISYESSEYAYEQSFVPADLGGDNAFGFTYSKELADLDYSDLVNAYKYNGTDYEEISGYSVKAIGNQLKVDFGSALSDGDTIRITVDGKILSDSYSVCTNEAEALFTVNAASPYFKITDSTVSDGAQLDSLSELTLTFSNEPDSALYIPDYFTVYRNGEKLYNAYEAVINGNKIQFKALKKFTPGEYTLKINPGYADKFGNKYVGITEYSFVIGDNEQSGEVVTVFSASDDEHMTALSKYLTPFSDITNLYSRTARVDYTAGKSTNGWLRENSSFDATGMKYLNFWMYSPSVSGDTAHIALYTSLKNNKYNKNNNVYKMNVDWQGWKLISIPLSTLTNASAFDSFLINFGGWTTPVDNNSFFLVDEVWMSAVQPGAVELKGTSFADGYTGAALSGEILELTFGTELAEKQNADIVITDKDGNVLDDGAYSVEYSTDSLTVFFGELMPSTTYNVHISGIVGKQPVKQTKPVNMSFTTASGGVYLTDIKCIDTVDFVIKNMSDSSAELTAVVYAIGEDNVLLKKYESKKTVSAKSEDIISTEAVFPDGTEKIKAFVLDSDGRFVSDKFADILSGTAKYTLSSVLGGSEAKVLAEALLNVNLLEVNAEISAASSLARIEICDKDGNIVSADACDAADGKLQYYYVFSEDMPSGVYTAYVYADGLKASDKISYLSKKDREEILTLANGDDEDSLADFIADNAQSLGVSGIGRELCRDIARLAMGRDGFGNYTEVVDFVSDIYDFINKVNSTPWSGLAQLIEDNSDYLDINEYDISYFTGLSDKKQNMICSILKGALPAESISDLIEKLSYAEEEFEADDTSSGVSSGGSSGGGGGGGKSSGGSFPAADVNNYTPVEAATAFTDLSYAQWAADSVMTLYKKGIISSSASNTFRPNDNITREEFVKLVVCAFAGDMVPAKHSFADVDTNAWYNKYIAIAYGAGITSGYTDGRFGVGENITREDMVTIIARTLTIMGKELPGGSIEQFNDSDTISDYARGYVASMVRLGVVNGMGNGSFAPKAYSTRAQAAKVIAGLMELF